MKFRFEAIADGGVVTRGVLRAENEDEAREILLGEAVFPKSLEATSEDEKVTWAPASLVKEKLEKHRQSFEQTEVSFSDDSPKMEVTCLFGLGGYHRGRVGVSRSNELVFEPASEKVEMFSVKRENVEVVRYMGFFPRRVQVVLLNGKTYEFSCGQLFVSSTMKQIIRRVFGSNK